MELRQRAAQKDEGDGVRTSERSLLKRVKTIDMFPKPKEDFQRQQSAQGAIVSVAAVAIIGILLLWELGGYLTGKDAYSTDLAVSDRSHQDVTFNIDITFPHLQCHDISLDVMDAAGGMQMNIAHEMEKSPVDKKGNLVFTSKFDFLRHRKTTKGASSTTEPSRHHAYDPVLDPMSSQYCGPCYVEEGCCNTCQSVMEAYDRAKVSRPHRSQVDQCALEIGRSHPGCNIKGSVVVKQVRGNFHFKPGIGVEGPFGYHVHEYDYGQLRRFDVAHIINHLSVGSDEGRFSRNGVTFPLDGTTHMTGGSLMAIHHFLNIVPTSYITSSRTYSSYEFSSQKYQRAMGQMGMMDPSASPGLYFLYDFHAMEVQNTFRRPHFGHFLVQLCGIIGGLFVILGLVDRAVEIFVRQQTP